MKKKMTILLDMDDVVTDYLPCLFEEYNNYFNTNHSIERINKWEFPKDLKDGILTVQENTDFLTRVREKGNSISFINKWLREGYNIYIVSDCRNSSKDYEQKLLWIKQNIPTFNPSHFIPCSKKYMIKGDIFVDDNIENLNKWSLANPYGHDLLMTAQHNKKVKDWRRVNTFEEIDDTIKTIEYLEYLRSEVSKARQGD